MKILKVCSCGFLSFMGVLVMLLGITGELSYFKYSPDVPFYLGILLLTLASIIGFSMKSPDESQEPWP
jgi:hypothetical protein